MSFEVKNIEDENINYKMIGPLTFFVVITVIASMVFVYYYFIFEKDSIMKEQYLEADSKISQKYFSEQQKKYESLNFNDKKDKVLEDYSNEKTIEQRLNTMDGLLEDQLLSDAFEELIERGRKNPNQGVQAFYKDRVLDIQWIIEDPNNTYAEYGMTPDGKWGRDSYDEWRKWKKNRLNK